ncbi:MAG: ferritin-like domain-containing protein [Planctomycetes bacterium]|nr:ferritin-like domain-containing protein [Planctomycetota bacterium]
MIKITKPAEVDRSDRLNLRVRVHRHLALQAPKAFPARDGAPVLELLQEALAEETASLRRWRSRHYFYLLLATGLDPQAVANESHQHGAQTQAHVDWLNGRIRELGGSEGETPDGHPGLEFAASVSSAECEALIRDDLAQERRVIEVYGQILKRLSQVDSLSFRIVELIREEKAKHAALLANLVHRRRTRDPEYRQRPG